MEFSGWLAGCLISLPKITQARSTHLHKGCLSLPVAACLPVQSSKLQALYTQTQTALEASDARVKQLTAQLDTAQKEAGRLKQDMSKLQVRTACMQWPPT